MSRAPTRNDLRHAAQSRGRQAVRPGAQDAADQFVRQFGGGDVEHAANQAIVDERFHRLAAGAGGVEDEHFVTGLLRDLPGGLDARGGHAEHGRGEERLVVHHPRVATRGLACFTMPIMAAAAFVQDDAADAVEPADVHDAVHHQNVANADVVPHLRRWPAC